MLHMTSQWKDAVELTRVLTLKGSDEVKMTAARVLDHWQRSGFLPRAEPRQLPCQEPRFIFMTIGIGQSVVVRSINNFNLNYK